MTSVNAYIPIVSAISTVLLLAANLYYVKKFRESVDIQRRTSQGDLLMQIINQFFYTEPHKSIIRRLDEGGVLRAAPHVAHGFKDTDLDDHLGMLDTIGTFVKAGILDRNLVWAIFSHYIESAYESPELAKYVKECQAISSSYFEDFIWLQKQFANQR